MLLDLPPVPADDAERLEHRWGIVVAMEMLTEGLISPADFLELCEEAAEAASALVHEQDDVFRTVTPGWFDDRAGLRAAG